MRNLIEAIKRFFGRTPDHKPLKLSSDERTRRFMATKRSSVR